MVIEAQSMTNEQRKSVILDYLMRMDRGEDVSDLIADHVQIYFPKWGYRMGKEEFGQLVQDLRSIVSTVGHEYPYFNWFYDGDTVVVEGTSYGVTKDDRKWRAGVTHGGRWCDVYEIRHFKIQRLFIYLDPDYGGADTARYPWLQK
jgi:hypothetical protein